MGRMNVAAYQEKEKNKKTGKRKAGEERRQADFKEAACYPSSVVQGAARQKMVCVRGVPGVTGTLGKTNSHFNPTEPHHYVEAAFDWCSSILLALHVYTIYTTETSHFIIQKDRSQYVFWGRTEGPY